MQMGIRGCSEHAEDFHFPLMRLVAVPGEAARPHAAARSPLARLQLGSEAGWALGLLRGLAWPPASARELAPALGRGSPHTAPPPTLGERLLAGLWSRRGAQGCLQPAEPPARAAAALQSKQRSGDQMP